MSTNGDVNKMKNFNLIIHYLYLFLAGAFIFIGIYDLVNYSRGMTFALYGNIVEGWYFILYMVILFGMSGLIMLLSKINLDTHIKKQLGASDNTL